MPYVPVSEYIFNPILYFISSVSIHSFRFYVIALFGCFKDVMFSVHDFPIFLFCLLFLPCLFAVCLFFYIRLPGLAGMCNSTAHAVLLHSEWPAAMLPYKQAGEHRCPQKPDI